MTFTTSGTQVVKQKHDQLDFIRAREVHLRGSRYIRECSMSHDDAQSKACDEISSEIESSYRDETINHNARNVYRIYYRQERDTDNSEYSVVDATVRGVLHDWESTKLVLTDIIRKKYDPKCYRVIVFYHCKDCLA